MKTKNKKVSFLIFFCFGEKKSLGRKEQIVLGERGKN